MDFSPNKTPIEIIKEGTFGGTYFRDIYSGINGNWYKISWKEFDPLKNIDQKYYCSDYYDVSVNKYRVKCGTSLRFWENKGWINEIDPYGWFQWFFRRIDDDGRQNQKMMKDKLIDGKKIVCRFRGKLVKLIKDAGGKFDDNSISAKITQMFLHWGYELTEKDFFNDLTNKCIKMNYY